MNEILPSIFYVKQSFLCIIFSSQKLWTVQLCPSKKSIKKRMKYSSTETFQVKIMMGTKEIWKGKSIRPTCLLSVNERTHIRMATIYYILYKQGKKICNIACIKTRVQITIHWLLLHHGMFKAIPITTHCSFQLFSLIPHMDERSFLLPA